MQETNGNAVNGARPNTVADGAFALGAVPFPHELGPNSGHMTHVRSRVNLEELDKEKMKRETSANEAKTPLGHHRTPTNVTIDLTLSSKITRLVVVRYFLDRPGYEMMQNSTARFWFDPPAICKPHHVEAFLEEQNIALKGLLIEVFLDKVQSFMILEACEACMLEWDFRDTTIDDPGVLNVRLTDVAGASLEERMEPFPGPSGPCVSSKAAEHKEPELANVTPAGLFSFSMMVGLETAALTGHLFPGSVSEAYVLKWAPYMFFVGGLMQILVAIFQVLRNNIYGATAFLGFGSFWFSNGLISILETFFATETSPADDLLGMSDPLGYFIRLFFIFAFCCALEVQTFAMNKLSSTLIALLSIKVFCQAFTGWFVGAMWAQLVFGWITSAFAFYVFLVEFTNSIYHREVFRVHRWSEKRSPEEVFGAPGRQGTLHSKAARLRQAKYPNVRRLREAPTTPSVKL